MNLTNKNIRGFDFDLSQLNKADVININESKTPLAHVHAGSLRRIFLHFQLQQWLLGDNYKSYIFIGNDDYDPYDYFPIYFNEEQRKQYHVYLGHPLCSVPAPEGKGNYSDYYFDEMIKILRNNFGIVVKTYKTSELYRQGFFNKGISLVLKNLDKINEIYKDITGINDKFSSKPLQVICPKCGNMRTTKIINYKEDKVEIICNNYELKKVSFIGCGFEGWVSPYYGNARLFWKLEWPIRWFYMKIGVEGGRKDQNSEKGAREFAEAVYRFLFNQKPPMNLPYDFCYINAEHLPKINRFGVSATEALKFLPPQLFFDLLTKPRSTKPIDIDLESEKMLDIYRDYVKRYLGDHNGQLFDKILENVRFGNGIKLSGSQESLAKCLKYYLHNSSAVTAWFLDFTPKKVSGNEKDFLIRLVRDLENVEKWQASDIQSVFRKVVTDANFSIRESYSLIYKLLINRQAGLRIGVLFEKIGRVRLIEYLKLYQ